MVKLSTAVECKPSGIAFSLKDSILILGSCFADNIGSRMKDAGFRVCTNPFGTLYNPASIAMAVERLRSATPFTMEECIEMGAGAGKVCSYMHHTSFARSTAAEFLDVANESLASASEFWRECNKVIITLGTAFVWSTGGKVVSNCLKRPAYEFERRMMMVDECAELIKSTLEKGKDTLLTVSPIRHLSDGAHANTLSKSVLQLAVASTGLPYFPAYEILLDELRDYRFFAEDLVHPSKTAVDIIWERFVESMVPGTEHEILKANEKASKAAAHRSILKLSKQLQQASI